VREFGRSRFVVVALSHADTNNNFEYIYVVGGAPDGGETPSWMVFGSAEGQARDGKLQGRTSEVQTSRSGGNVFHHCAVSCTNLTFDCDNVDTLAPVSQ